MKKYLHEEEYVEVGFVRKAYGYNGAVRIGCDDIFIDDIVDSNFIFIEIRGLKVPFKPKQTSTEKDLVIHFENVENEKEVATILGQKIYLLKKNVIHAHKAISEQDELYQWLGYHIIDQSSNRPFEIIDIVEFPQQLMAVVNKDGNELFIPLNEEFLKEVNNNNRTLLMELPEGLLDL